jgi:predicted nucleic acid-binding protein
MFGMENKQVFMDTSAFYALMDRSDSNHEQAVGLWASLLEKDFYLCTGNYVIVETLALLQSRLGFEAGNLWYRDVLTLAEILWIDGAMHNLAYELWLSLGRRRLSFVDCVSFVVMRHHKIEKVFGFDRHFVEQGFENI